MARGLSTLVVDWSTPDLRIFFVTIFVKKKCEKRAQKKPRSGLLINSIYQGLLEKLRSKLAQVHAPVSPGMSAFTFYISMRHLHPL